MSAKSARCSTVKALLKPVWCAPPAKIHAVAATFRLGSGTHSARATGSFGNFFFGVKTSDPVYYHAEAVSHVNEACIHRPVQVPM